MKTAGAILAASLLGLVQPASAQTDPGAIDLSDRETARTWHNTWWPKSHGAPMGFTGDASTGTPGDISQAYRDQTVLRINIFRRMAGLQPVTADPEYNRLCQAAAVLMSANGKISHNPDPTWKFFTDEAFRGAQGSSLDLGLNGPTAILSYLYDWGPLNAGIGHRQFLLEPALRRIGTGDSPAQTSLQPANALGDSLDIGLLTRDAEYSPDVVVWPPPGYVPNYLIPGRWGVWAKEWRHPVVDLRNAEVVITINTRSLPPRKCGNTNGTAAIWTVDGTEEGTTYGWYSVAGEQIFGPYTLPDDTAYHVAVRGILDKAGQPYNGNGSIEYDVISYDPNSPTLSPTIGSHPRSVTTYVGAAVTISVEAASAYYYQWYKNEAIVAGATQNTLRIQSATFADSGSYRCVVYGRSGKAISESAYIAVREPNDGTTSRLINISTRSYVGTGDEIQIAGFVVGGTATKRLLLRAAGPALHQFGVSGFLDDPIIQLVDDSGKSIAENDNWDFATQQESPSVAWWFEKSSHDAALIATVAPGKYTAKVLGKDNHTGVALVEVFELEPGSSRLANLSTRSLARSGDEIQIAGLIVEGTAPKTVLLRAAGPSLAQFGVPGLLHDPVIQLYNGDRELLAENDDWTISTRAQSSVVPWWFVESSKDAALIITLAPGNYTAKVFGRDGEAGVALVEIYELP